MKKIIINIAVILLTMSATLVAQNSGIKKTDFDNIIKQIGDSLPDGWVIKTDTALTDEVIIHSQVIELEPDITSNDPPQLTGQCEIFIMVVPRISPESIFRIQKKNEELRSNLPPQDSKDNLKTWYIQNEKTLKMLDAEPTHYDNNYSYRIKCRRLPQSDADLSQYFKVMEYLNKIFKKY